VRVISLKLKMHDLLQAVSPRGCVLLAFLKKRPVVLLAVLFFLVESLCIAGAVWSQEQDNSSVPQEVAADSQSRAVSPKAGIPETDSDALSGPYSVSSIYSNALPKRKAYFRTAVEEILFLGISESYYQATLTTPDWYEYKTWGDSLHARFQTGNAFRLDVNSWGTNVGHVAAGTSYYLLARTNDLDLPQSFLIGAGASTFWEMFGEFRDEFSINDAIVTPFAGFSTGEVIYQYGEFFQHSSNTFPNRLLGYVFGPSAAFHRWLDNTQPKPPENVDKFGFTTDAWHRFRVFAGGGGSDPGDSGKQRAEGEMGFDFELVTAEKYAKPGEACLFYLEGLFNDLSFQASYAGDTMVDLRFLAKTAFWGRYEQDIVKDEARGSLEGYDLFMGLSSAFEYYGHDFSGMRLEDRLAICDLVGPALIADYYYRGFRLRAAVDVFPTFSLVDPAAGDLYNEDHNIKNARYIYQSHGYYYAIGMGTSGKVELDYGPFGLEGRARYHLFDSIDGLDRVQERVTKDILFEDERLSLEAELYWKLPVENLKLALDVERLYRWSNIADLSYNMDETRYFAKVVFEF